MHDENYKRIFAFPRVIEDLLTEPTLAPDRLTGLVVLTRRNDAPTCSRR